MIVVMARAASRQRSVTVATGRFSALVCRGLAQLLLETGGILIAGLDLDNVDLERLAAQRAAQVAILDEEIVVEPEALERLRAASPGIGIVVLGLHPSRARWAQRIAPGAVCVPKDAPASEIVAAVHLAAGTSPEPGDPVARRPEPDVRPKADLTPREKEVLKLLSAGRSYPEIASALQISLETARTHGAHVREKLGVPNKRQLIGWPVPGEVEDRRDGQ